MNDKGLPYYNKELNAYLYVDGKEYNHPLKNLERFFKLQSNKLWKLEAVGIYITKDRINVFLPKNTDELKVTKREIELLVNCLKFNLFSEEKEGSNCYIEVNDLYKIINWLILDFKQNGIYIWRQRESKIQNKGKIDWSKTIKKVTPVILEENAYYNSYIKNKYDRQNNFFTLVHEQVMESISKNYGKFIWNFSFKSNSSFKKWSMNLDGLEIILKKKIHSTNVIREKNLFKNIISYIKHTRDLSKEIIIVTQEFHVLFEDAMRSYLKHRDLSERIPKANWDFYFYGHKTSANRQIVDAFVINEDNSVDIYDAKYYSLEKIKTKKNITPLDWYSVGKQFFYQLSFQEKVPNKTSYTLGKNSFIFPIYPIPKEFNDRRVYQKDENITRIGNISVTIMNEKKYIELFIANTFSFLQAWYDKHNF